MSESLLDNLRVRTAGDGERGSRVTQVVPPKRGKARPFNSRREDSAAEVVAM